MNDYSFDNFIVTQNNEEALVLAKEIVSNPDKRHNPLFIFGESNTGKTHLLYSIEKYSHEINPNEVVIHVNGNEFTDSVIGALRSGNSFIEISELRKYYKSADLFLMDDFQYISGREISSHEFTDLFNYLYEKGKRMVLTSNVSPQILKDKGCLERLASRILWGSVVEITR